MEGLETTAGKKSVKCKDLSLKAYRVKGFPLSTPCLKRLGIFNLTFTSRQIGSRGGSGKNSFAFFSHSLSLGLNDLQFGRHQN